MTAIDPSLERTLLDYLQGLFHGDVALLRQAFAPDARLTGIVNGARYDKALADYLTIVAGRQSPADLGETNRMRIVSVETHGSIATAILNVPMLGYDYVDHLSLRRNDSGHWRIDHKLFTDISPQS